MVHLPSLADNPARSWSEHLAGAVVAWFGAQQVDSRDEHERDRARQRTVIALIIGALSAFHALRVGRPDALELSLPWMCLLYAGCAVLHLKTALREPGGGPVLLLLFVVADSLLTVLALACVPQMLATLYPVLMVQIVRVGMRYGLRTLWLGWGAAVAASAVLLPFSAFWHDNPLLLKSYVVMLVLTPILMVPLVRRLQAASDMLRAAASADPLTELANRRVLDERLALAQDQSARDGTMVALVLIDLDNFKRVNDTLGHGPGDQLLLGVAAALRSVSRSGDLVARLGGDEFVLLVDGLPVTTGAARVHEIADAAVCRVREAADALAPGMGVGASAGICCWVHGRDAPSTGAELLARADEAMYHAKRAGKSRCAMAVARSA